MAKEVLVQPSMLQAERLSLMKFVQAEIYKKNSNRPRQILIIGHREAVVFLKHEANVIR
jgi:hypothetical protein